MDAKVGKVTKVLVGYNYSDANDYDRRMANMRDFVTEADLDVMSHEFIDVSDTSSEWDIIAEFVFGNEQDAMLFTLKFKK
jgi:hypothetical protein